MHQETFIAVAEPTATSIYDNQGIEVHHLKKFGRILRLEFLPYHFLLVGSAENGFLYYLDASTGTIVASIPTYMGRLQSMCQNPANAVITTGNHAGVIAMWTPAEKSFLVKLFAHQSAITSIACDPTGSYLATAGSDRKLKIWDLRSTYDPLAEISLPNPSVTMSYSQRGLLAIGCGNTVQILRDPHLMSSSTTTIEQVRQESLGSNVNRRQLANAYLSHYLTRPVSHLRFCPYEDVLGVGTSDGIASLLCPGSGEPNFDALEANPYGSKRYRQEREVKRLLDKIPYNMISLKSVVGQVRREDIFEEWEKKKAALLGEKPKLEVPEARRNKGKGRSKPTSVEAAKRNLYFERRKMFTMANVMGLDEVKQRRQLAKAKKKQQASKQSSSSVPVSSKPLTKRRVKSALDVLIPAKQ